jgi:ubiquinone/menaquinone biosynthesis C-methylase UbiE
MATATKTAAYKRNERELWNQFSRRYIRVAMPEFVPYGRRLIEMAGVQKGMWVLDVATGPGEPALTIARRVGPAGLVLGVDFSPAMLRAARARARRLALRNVQFREMDAERLTLEGMMFDRVFCRFGLMLMPDAERALAEMHRVLVPGGRLAVAVWSTQQKVNTLGLVRRALTKHHAFTLPEGAPDFFRLGKAGAIERALRASGFRHVRRERMTVEWVFKDPADYWRSMRQGPSIKRALAKVPPSVRRAIKAEVCRSLARFVRNGKLRLPNEAVLVVATRP